MTEVSHVISRCAHCSGLTKMRIAQFVNIMLDEYIKANTDERSEVVVLCDTCRAKQ